jgi:hypothetical protein
LLEESKIPFRYEPLMKFGQKSIYPDFMIKRPYDGKIIIWEHFGALNQPEYIQKMNEKMADYFKSDFKAFKNLIYTFEFDICPQRLNQIIKELLIQ